MNEITTDVIASRVVEELETLPLEDNNDLLDASQGLVLFVGGVDSSGEICCIM